MMAVLRAEWVRILGRPGFRGALVLVPLVVALEACFWSLAPELERLSGGAPARVGGFLLFARTAQHAVLVAAAAVMLLAARDLTDEAEAGCLRALLACPPSRLAIYGGKTLVFVLGGLMLLAVAIAASLAAGALAGGYTDLVEEGLQRLSAWDLAAEAVRALLFAVPAVAALAVLGLAISALSSSTGGAMSAAAALLGLAWLADGLVPALGAWTPLHHLGESLRIFELHAGGFFDRDFGRAQMLRALMVPAIWALAAFGLAATIFVRRDVTS